MAADLATTESLHFIIDNTSGVVCVGMLGNDLDRLRIPLMINSQENDESMSTAFTITVDLREGTTTGISASDRAATIRALADPTTQPDDLRRPGHIFPLRSRPGGVLTRPGHTEASVDLAYLAGRAPAGVMCEVVNRTDGSMSRTPELLAFARTHGLRCVTIEDLVRYRLASECLASGITEVEQVVQQHGDDAAMGMMVQEYTAMDGAWHVVAMYNPQREGPLHVHRQQLLGDVFGLHTAAASASSSSNGHSTAPTSSVRDAAARVAQHGGTLVYIVPQQGRPLPDHLIKACSKAPGGGQRALELAVARAVLRVLGGGVPVEVGMVGERADEDAACWAWWDAQQHPTQ